MSHPDVPSHGPDPVQFTRTVDAESDAAAATVRLEATVDEAATVTLFEAFEPAFESVAIVDADGADRTGVREDASGLVATYGERTNVTLVYEVAAGDDAAVDAYAFEGHSVTAVARGSIEATTAGDDALEGGDSIELNGYEPQPVDGSELYLDVDGSGSLGSNDVVAFFEHLEEPAVQSNPDYFDFNGSGSVGFEDVTELFRRL